MYMCRNVLIIFYNFINSFWILGYCQVSRWLACLYFLLTNVCTSIYKQAYFCELCFSRYPPSAMRRRMIFFRTTKSRTCGRDDLVTYMRMRRLGTHAAYKWAAACTRESQAALCGPPRRTATDFAACADEGGQPPTAPLACIATSSSNSLPHLAAAVFWWLASVGWFVRCGGRRRRKQ
jgi:hypothetical protein